MPKPIKNTIRGQKITTKKHSLAKNMRSNMTPAETKLWAQLRGNRLSGYHFRRQQVIEPYIVDFYCHQSALIIEIDGDIHQYKHQEDKIRENYLKELGYHILRFTNQQIVHELDHVLNTIFETLSS
jgi:very-short-patch-repair endonuclease